MKEMNNSFKERLWLKTQPLLYKIDHVLAYLVLSHLQC